MSSTLDLRTVKPGDVVEYRQTYRVAGVTGLHVRLCDVQNDIFLRTEFVGLDHRDSGRYILVSKAPVPAPVAGDILTGYQVRERMWKRGTVIQCVEGADFPSPLFLQGAGIWTDTEAFDYEFEDLNDEAHFKLLHVAQ